MSLHLAFTTSGLKACLPLLQADDVLVLLDAATRDLHGPIGAGCQTYVIDDAVCDHAAQRIGYDELVQLCVEHTPSISWS